MIVHLLSIPHNDFWIFFVVTKGEILADKKILCVRIGGRTACLGKLNCSYSQ